MSEESITLAELVRSQNGKLELDQARRLVLDIEKEMKHLKKKGLGLLIVDLHSVIWTPDHGFTLTKDAVTAPIDDDELVVTHPLDREHPFLSPELHAIRTLPARVSPTVSYYSVGKLILCCMTGQTNEGRISELGHLSLAYFLRRCLQPDPSQRAYLYI